MATRLVNTLDHAPRFLFWPIDEFLAIVLPFFLGILFSSLSLILLAPCSKWAYTRLKRRLGRGKFQALCYWHLPKEAFFGHIKNLPPSHQRTFFL